VKLPIDIAATDGNARSGWVNTARGGFPSPCFMPVGTRGAVKTLSSEDLERLGAPVILGNTYHLMLRPGVELIEELGGLHRFMDWPGHILTDSGGYQVFSLGPKVDDAGATFRSTYDGSLHHLTPELAVAIQTGLGADIQMVLDVCPPLPSTEQVVRLAVDRTANWAARARAAFTDPAVVDRRRTNQQEQAQFGIVQGGVDEALRRESAERTVALDFDGYAIGGLSVGESREEMLPALAAALEGLPADRPRYLMGVGDPVSMVEAVGLGVDMFDCVLPTRLARHGTILTSEGRLPIRNATYARDAGPLDERCGCPTCARWSRAYIRHLLRVGEPAAGRLLTMHNVWWILDLVRRLAEAITAGTFAALRADVLAVWG